MRPVHFPVLLFAVSAVALSPHPLPAHGDHGPEGSDVPLVEPIAAGLPESQVTIKESGDRRIIESNGLPNHKTGQFPGPANPNTIRAQNFSFSMPLAPKANGKPRPIRPYYFGVAVNGVKFDPGTAEYYKRIRGSIWNEEAIVNGKGKLGLDASNAHVQPDGSYHYHGVPNGLVEQLKGGKTMVLLGWAADGFPIYGPWAHRAAGDAASPVEEMHSSYRLKDGSRPDGAEAPGGRYDGTYTADFEYVEGSGDLDECNGRTGVTPEFPRGTYYYVLTREFPNVPRMFKGTPDESFRHAGPGGGGGPGGPGGPPGGRRPGGPL